MQILGIETSCDETAAAVVEEVEDPARPWLLRSNVVASQADIHREWGGVVPEIASRQHVRDICGVVERALEQAGSTLDDIGAVAVTHGPGLVGSLLVGVSFAKALAVSRGLPLVPVHHLAGHIESLFLHNGPLPLPAVVLVVSGGHTSLYAVTEPGHYQSLGRTRDDAAGARGRFDVDFAFLLLISEHSGAGRMWPRVHDDHRVQDAQLQRHGGGAPVPQPALRHLGRW